MLGKKPLYKITDYQGKVLLFMYEYSENQMLNDRHQNGLQHYSYFKEQVLLIIKRDYDTVSCIKTMELTTITYLEFLWHNLWAKIDDMITVIPAPSYNIYKIDKSSINVTKKVINNIKQSDIKIIDLFVVTDKDGLERLKKDDLIYNGALVRYINLNNTSKFYIYNNGIYTLLDMDFVSSIIDNSGNVSQDKT